MVEFDENEDEDEREIPISRKIIHEIRDVRGIKPKKKKPKTEDKNDKVDDDKLEFLSRASELFFEGEKERLIADYPEHASKIRSVESGIDLDLLREKLEDDEGITTPIIKGKATLIQQPSNSDLETANSHGSLINKLYREAKKWKSPHKEDATDKINTLRKTMTENVSKKQILDTIGSYGLCPSCGNVVEANFNRKGSTCPICGFVSGQGVIRKKVVF